MLSLKSHVVSILIGPAPKCYPEIHLEAPNSPNLLKPPRPTLCQQRCGLKLLGEVLIGAERIAAWTSREPCDGLRHTELWDWDLGFDNSLCSKQLGLQ